MRTLIAAASIIRFTAAPLTHTASTIGIGSALAMRAFACARLNAWQIAGSDKGAA